MNSIRARLMVWLLVLFTVLWLLVTLATYLTSQHEVEELFDAQLAQAAGALSAIGLLEVEPAALPEHQLAEEVYGHRYEKKIAFQVWDGNALVLRSAAAPDTPMAFYTGYSDQTLGGAKWRVFYLHTEDGHRVFVGERHDVRDELIQEITVRALFPLTLALPALALMIWFGLGRGLAPLRRIAHAVAARSPRNLDPVTLRTAPPAEVRPLVSALNDLLARLGAAFERERHFTADAAHELRTPLASLKTQAQVALRATDDAQRRHALEHIAQGVDRTSHLVQQLLTLARLDPEASTHPFERVDLRTLAAEVLAEAAGAAHAKGIELALEEGPPAPLEGHAAALGILLGNLVDNAVKYAPPGTTVEVALAAGPEGAQLTVSDQGPGIPPAEREQVLARFYRGRDAPGYGAGLGLSIVQRIAQLHRARLDLEDGPDGRGLRVRVSFPAAPRAGSE